MSRFEGKVAVVTGSAKGIGRAVAQGFAEEGARVAIVDNLEEVGRATAADIVRSGGMATFIRADLSKREDIENLFNSVSALFGRIDVLHNNAGITSPQDNFLDCSPELWDRILAVNLTSIFLCSQKAANMMIAQKSGGRILNTASTTVFRASPGPQAAYDVSKAGVRQLTLSLAKHLGVHGINVNAIAPGLILTDLAAFIMNDEALLASRVAAIPLGRGGQPTDLVGASLFLCSDEAAYITGQVVAIDGGRTL